MQICIILHHQTTTAMNTQQAIEALIALTDRKTNKFPVSKSSNAFQSALLAIQKPSTEIVVGENYGSGRHASSKSWQYETVALLKRAGIWNEKCQEFNVAARGGKAGDRIAVNF